MGVDTKEIDGSTHSHPVTGGPDIASSDGNKTFASASSLVLAALSAAEQDLGSHVLPMEPDAANTRVPSPSLNDSSHLEKEG